MRKLIVLALVGFVAQLVDGSLGMGYGVTSVFGAIPAEIFEGRHYGSIFGTLMLVALCGGALGPWVAGFVHDQTGSYTPAFWIAIGAVLLSVVAIWRAAPRRVRMVAGQIGRIRPESAVRRTAGG